MARSVSDSDDIHTQQADALTELDLNCARCAAQLCTLQERVKQYSIHVVEELREELPHDRREQVSLDA